MINERIRHEELPPDTSSLQSEEDIDGESLGSQDTTSGMSEDSEGEMSPVFEDPITPQTSPQKSAKRPRKSYADRKRKTETAKREQETPQKPRLPRTAASVPKRRGNYRSWARYRVAICQALCDAVFDSRKAAEILKNTQKLYVPASVLGYYARKLSLPGSQQPLPALFL
nr:MAG: 22K protein [Otus scops adenovirus]